MSRQLRTAVAAVMLMVAAPAAATAGERATLRVTARVVDRCTFAVPFSVPSRVWRERRHQPWRFVHHDCRGRPPFWVHVKEVLLERLRDRFDRFEDRFDRFEDRFDRFEDRFDRLEDRVDRFDDSGRTRSRRDDARVHEVRHPLRRDVVLVTITY